MNKEERAFVKTVRSFYRRQGRHALPWRMTHDPYRILVSEIMLQQTQVERVLPKYEAFIKRWPTVRALAQAPLAAVLRVWQGLGYNSRAKRLRDCARVVVHEYQGVFPQTYERLQSLPGIGPYTAGAVMAFAFNQPVPVIETNVRTVYLHHFFHDATDVSEAELMTLIEVTLDTKQPREWYWALMDYGAYLKKTHGNPNSRSKSYTKQSRFAGSDRQIRGAIVRALTISQATRAALQKQLTSFDQVRIDAQLQKLHREGLVARTGRSYHLPD